MKRAQPPEVLITTSNGRSLLFTLDAGQGVPPHRHPGMKAVLAVLAGQVEITTASAQTANAGQVIVHNGDADISVLALQPSRVLVTLLKN